MIDAKAMNAEADADAVDAEVLDAMNDATP